MFPDSHFLLHSFSPHHSSSDWYKLCIKWESLQPWFLLTALPIYYSSFSVQDTAVLLFSLSHTPRQGSKKVCGEYVDEWKKQKKSTQRRRAQMNGWEKDGREKMSDQKWNKPNIHTHIHTHLWVALYLLTPPSIAMLMLRLNTCAASCTSYKRGTASDILCVITTYLLLYGGHLKVQI